MPNSGQVDLQRVACVTAVAIRAGIVGQMTWTWQFEKADGTGGLAQPAEGDVRQPGRRGDLAGRAVAEPAGLGRRPGQPHGGRQARVRPDEPAPARRTDRAGRGPGRLAAVAGLCWSAPGRRTITGPRISSILASSVRVELDAGRLDVLADLLGPGRADDRGRDVRVLQRPRHGELRQRQARLRRRPARARWTRLRMSSVR